MSANACSRKRLASVVFLFEIRRLLRGAGGAVKQKDALSQGGFERVRHVWLLPRGVEIRGDGGHDTGAGRLSCPLGFVLGNFKGVADSVQATITTEKGEIHLELFPEHAPLTVANFVNLAARGYYDGLVFHRVIDNFMIQGGCPQGTGTGGPGYSFEDEFTPEVRHDQPGRLSMANAGPGTNGSQFFITHVPTPWLDDAHTIFGRVVGEADQSVVNAIGQGDRIDAIAISGDVDALLASQSDRVEQWNARLG